MRILILTQYYPPETGAPQNRLSSLAKYLACFGNDVEVLTALPNYPKYEIYPGYKGKNYLKETIDGIPVHRSYIVANSSRGLLKRLAVYFSFTISSYFSAIRRIRKPDVLICESPPLFLGITGVLLKRRWKCRLVFNVSDLWPESAEKMGIITNSFVIRRSYRLANWIYRNADLVSGQTQGIVKAIQKMQPGKELYWFPNGADVEKIEAVTTTVDIGGFVVLYAGILGHAQGLEVMLRAAEYLRNKPDIHFYIIGDGPEREKLAVLKEELKLANVTLMGNQPSAVVLGWVKRCNAYVVPLRKLELFRGAIPSKLFEPLAAGKPILLGVEGEAKELFIDAANAGLFYMPEDAGELKNGILKLYDDEALGEKLGSNGRLYVNNFFRRDKIAHDYWQRLQRL